MKEKVLLIFFLCNVALFVSAQSHMEKGLQSISRSSTEAIINFLAGDELRDAPPPKPDSMARV